MAPDPGPPDPRPPVAQPERCRTVVENSAQISDWERSPAGAGGNAAALTGESMALLAQPI